MKYKAYVIAMVSLVLIGAGNAQSNVCSTFTYQITPGYDFKGIIKFDYLDMNVQQGGIQNAVQASAGQRVTAQVRWTFGTSCPECNFFINVFGSWEPNKEIAKLYSGAAGSAPSISIVPISFEVPKQKGEHTLRVIYTLGEGHARNFQALNIIQSQCTVDRHVFFFDGLVNVTTALEGEPLGVSIISPTSPTGIAEETLGESILINGTIEGNASKISLYIDGKNVTDTLPFLWNTTNESEGVHIIALEAIDLANNTIRDEFRVELINRTAFGEQPDRLWVNVLDKNPVDLDLSRDGNWIVVGGENSLALYNFRGLMEWKQSLQGTPKAAISKDGRVIVAAIGKDIRYYDQKGGFLWNYTLPRDAGDVILTSSGYVAAATGKELYLLDNNGTRLWNTSIEDSITGLAFSQGDSMVAIAKNRVYAISNESEVKWTYVTPNLIGAVAASTRGDVVISSGKDIFHLSGNGTLRWSFLAPAPVSRLSVSQDGKYLAAASDRTLFFFEDTSVRWSMQLRESITNLRLSSDGAYLLSSHGNALSFYQNFPPQKKGFAALEDKRILILLLGVALVLGIYAYQRDKKRRMRVKISRVSKGEEAEAGINLEAVSEGLGLFKHVKVQVNIKNASTDKPVIKAVVGIGNRSVETDEEGKAVFDEIPKGSYELRVERELYEAVSEKIVLREQEERFQINLVPVSGLGETEVARLKNALGEVRNSYLAVPASDPCLPAYYKSIGEKVIDFVEKITDIPAFFKKVNYEEVVEELISAAEYTCRELGDVIGDWKNVKIYDRGSGSEGECSAPDFKGLAEFEEAMKDPEKFCEQRFPQIRRRLKILDDEITGRIKDITIMPISGVWRISEGLLSMTEVKDAAKPPSKLKIAILLLFADAMLDYVEDMLNNEKILERLEVSIL